MHNGRRRPTASRATADSQERDPEQGNSLVTSLAALAAAGLTAVAVQTGVVPPPTALAPTVMQAAQQVAQQAGTAAAAVPMLGGTAVATTTAAVVTSTQARREKAQQRTRLEALKREVAQLQVCRAFAHHPLPQPHHRAWAVPVPAGIWRGRWLLPASRSGRPHAVVAVAFFTLDRCCCGTPGPCPPQDLQQQELTLLQLQMNAKSQEFVAAWQSVQDDLSREADERAVVEGQLAAVQQQVGLG